LFGGGAGGSFGAEDVTPVVSGPGAAVFPLGVTGFASEVDFYPASFADGTASFSVAALKPRDDFKGFRFGAAVVEDVVVGEGDVEGVLFRSERAREESVALGTVGVVIAAVIIGPFRVP